MPTYHMYLAGSTPTSALTFSPERGWENPESHGWVNNFGSDKTIWRSDWGSKNMWELDITFITAYYADRLTSWWNNQATLTFYPDYSAPATITTSYEVLIINEPNPVTMERWKDKYRAHLTLYEV